MQKTIFYVILATPLALFCARPAKKPAWSETTLKQVVAMQKIYDNASKIAQLSADTDCFHVYGTLVHYGNDKWRRMQGWLLKDPVALAKTIVELEVIIKNPELSKKFAAAVKKIYNSPNIIV